MPLGKTVLIPYLIQFNLLITLLSSYFNSIKYLPFPVRGSLVTLSGFFINGTVEKLKYRHNTRKKQDADSLRNISDLIWQIIYSISKGYILEVETFYGNHCNIYK